MKFFLTLLFLAFLVQFGFVLEQLLLLFLNPKKNESRGWQFDWIRLPIYFGIATIGYTFFVTPLSMFGVRLNLFHFFTLNGLAVFLLATTSRKKIKADHPQEKSGVEPLIKFLFILIASLVFLKILSRLAFPSMAHDLLGHLLGKSEILIDGSYRDAYLMRSPLFANLHTTYPPLFPILFQLMFCFTSSIEAGYFHIVNGFIIFCLSLTIYRAMTNYASLREAAVWSFVLVSGRMYLTSSFTTDNVDVFLSLFYFLTITSLVQFLSSRSQFDLVLAGIFAAGSSLTKNEGVIFIGFSVIMLAISLFLKERQRKPNLLNLGRYCLTIFILACPWWYYRFTLPTAEDMNETFIFNVKFSTVFDYLQNTVKQYSVYTLQKNWNWVFPLWFLVAIVYFRKILKNPVLLFLNGMVGIQLAFQFIMLWLLFGKKIEGESTLILRLGAQIYPAVLFALALLVSTRGNFAEDSPNLKIANSA